MSESASGSAASSLEQSQERATTEHRYYWWIFSISIGTSILLILFSYQAFNKEAVQGGSFIGDVKNFIEYVGSGSACLIDNILNHHSLVGECTSKAGLHAPGAAAPHASVTLSSGIAQIIGVIAISALWFYTFIFHTSKSNSRKYIWFSLIATVSYVFGMFNAYQPAVLVAAIAAIFVAAEHFGKLEMQAKELTTHGGSLTCMVKDLGRITNSTQLSLSKAGREIFMEDVYGAYSRAETIYSVAHDHMIEDDWWWHAETEFAAKKGLAEVWKWYESTPAEKKILTLYTSLTQPDGIGRAARADRGVKCAYFVSYMPMPESDEWRKREHADLFGDLLGLAWECLVLDRVRTTLNQNELANHNDASNGKEPLNRNELIGEWISNPLCWAHATNMEVWQVTKRTEMKDSSVWKTADLRDGIDNPLDKVLSRKLIESTQAEIRRYLQRGMAAEEYLCTILCYATVNGASAATQASEGDAYNDIARCLRELNMAEWLERKDREPSSLAKGLPEARTIRERICVAIFTEFMEMCRNRPLDDADPNGRPTSSFSLAQEVL